MTVNLGPGARLRQSLSDEFAPDQLPRSLAAGGLLFVLEIVVILSFAVLIFSNGPDALAPAGIVLIIVGDILVLIIAAIFSSYPGSIAIGQDPATIIMATAAAAIAASMAGAAAETRFATLVLMVVVTTLTTGLLFLLLGIFKLGGLVRYLPYPVLGGFLAGTGFLLVTGGLNLATGESIGMGMFNADSLLLWLPALALGVILYFATRRFKNPLVLPALILGAIILFYIVTRAAGLTTADLIADGQLLGPIPTGALRQLPFSPDMLAAVDWSVIISHAGLLAPALVVSVIAMLLNGSGIELIVRRDIDLNHELVVMGGANVASGLVGGIIGYASVSFTTLNHTLSGGRRLPSLIVAFLMLLTVLIGGSLLSYIPKFVLGALIIQIGLSLLVQWVYEAWFKFSRLDFAIIILILAVIVWQGFLQGILVGLLTAIALFVVSYSRSNVVKHRLTGTTFRSRVTRSPDEQKTLNELGDQLLILQLQGFVFFGTANNLFERLREHIANEKTRIVLLDFSRVTGLDSTGLLSFDKLMHIADEQGVILVLTGLDQEIQQRFTRSGYSHRPGRLYFFPGLDAGVEWCEETLLSSVPPQRAGMERELADYLRELQPGDGVDTIVSYMTRKEVEPGTFLIQQGDEADNMFFIESGQVTAQRESPDGQLVRLETMHGGRMVGELGFYLDTPRSAAVVADTAAVVYLLTREDLARMETEDPIAANAFHRIIVKLQGERTHHLTRALDALEG